MVGKMKCKVGDLVIVKHANFKGIFTITAIENHSPMMTSGRFIQYYKLNVECPYFIYDFHVKAILTSKTSKVLYGTTKV